jgi:dipeptidyl-peptidase-4
LTRFSGNSGKFRHNRPAQLLKYFHQRYLTLLSVNLEGYELTSVMKYAPELKGKLMIYYGTAVNNVYPSNLLQLINSLQKAGKSFEVQVGPDRGHTAVSMERMMEFLFKIWY